MPLQNFMVIRPIVAEILNGLHDANRLYQPSLGLKWWLYVLLLHVLVHLWVQPCCCSVTDCVTATWPLSVPSITSGWSSVCCCLLLHHICACALVLWCNTWSRWHRKPFDYRTASVRAARAGPATWGGMSGHADGFFLFCSDALMFHPLKCFPLPLQSYFMYHDFHKWYSWHHNFLYLALLFEDWGLFELGEHTVRNLMNT